MSEKSLKNNWEKIWNNRDISKTIKYKNVLEKLMYANGHIGKNKSINVISWKKYSKNIIKILSPEKKSSLFEVGCGSGALLYLLKGEYNDYGGCDYSKSLVSIASKYLNKKKVFFQNAKQLTSSKKFDHVIASSVFEYLTPLEIKKVLENMVNKSKKKILILEILNKSLNKQFLRKFKKKLSSKINYSFFDKKFFLDFAKKKNLKITFFSSLIPYSKQKKYRYNVLLSKKNERKKYSRT